MNGNLFPELVSDRIAQIERDFTHGTYRAHGTRRSLRGRLGHRLVSIGRRLEGECRELTPAAR